MMKIEEICDSYVYDLYIFYLIVFGAIVWYYFCFILEARMNIGPAGIVPTHIKRKFWFWDSALVMFHCW